MRFEWTAVLLFVLNVAIAFARGRAAAPNDPERPLGPVVHQIASSDGPEDPA